MLSIAVVAGQAITGVYNHSLANGGEMPSPRNWAKGHSSYYVDARTLRDLRSGKKSVVVLPDRRRPSKFSEAMILILGQSENRDPFRVVVIRRYDGYETLIKEEHLPALGHATREGAEAFLRTAHAEGKEKKAPDGPLAALVVCKISHDEAKRAPRY